MKKVFLLSAFAFLAAVGVVFAQEITPPENPLAPPATTPAIESNGQGIGQDVSAINKEAEAKIKALKQEMEARIKAIRAEYQANSKAIRADAKAKVKSLKETRKAGAEKKKEGKKGGKKEKKGETPIPAPTTGQ